MAEGGTMTLEGWRIANPHIPALPFGQDGAVQVFTGSLTDHCWHLYHLTDYVVSSAVSGPSIILVPRRD